MVVTHTPRSTPHAPRTYAFGLIGYPLGHSLSPQIHGAALHALSLSGEYRLYPVPPHASRPSPPGRGAGGEGKNSLTLETLLAKVRTGEIHGLNVTIPHKQNVIPLLDKLTPAAQTIGAVNTIFLQNGLLIGDNTDAPGFWGDLQRLAVSGERGTDAAHRTPHAALVLGSGGGARAVVYALLTHGYHVTISTRCEDQTQAETLKNDLSVVSDQIDIICLETDHPALRTSHFARLINCTPVGQHPHEDASPWPGEIALPPHAAVYDLVYNPRETLLVKQARSAGLPAATGLGMLVEQAALAFERWTGLEAPRDTMMEAVKW